MPRRSDATIFLDKIRAFGGRVTNKALRVGLNWEETKYWNMHQQMFDAGKIEKGRGPGGTVILVSEDNPMAAADVAATGEVPSDAGATESVQPDAAAQGLREVDLYPPALAQFNANWSSRRQLDQCHCEITAQQGRRETGGSWTRPDITIVGYKKYEYLPDKIMELFTFEVKASYDVSIKGVLEALAHREAATRSYVVYHTAGRDLAEFPEAVRIEELAARHGVGVIAAKIIDDFSTWDEVATAPRASPDPDLLETFIKRTLSEEGKSKLRKWF